MKADIKIFPQNIDASFCLISLSQDVFEIIVEETMTLLGPSMWIDA